jgi:hypothetical protein
MTKAKKKGKAEGKKKRKKSSKSKKEKSPAEVRQDISKLVKAHATELAGAVIGEGEKGQLAPTKYLFELAGVYPASTDGSLTTEHEESLAETVFKKLNVPTIPVKLNDEDDEDVVVNSAQEKPPTTENTEEHGESPKPFTAQPTEKQREDAGEPSGV